MPPPFDLLPLLLQGAVMTISLTLVAAALALVVALAAGLGRLSKHALVRRLVGAYIEFFRGTSVLVQMFWLFYALPLLIGLSFPSFVAGVLALGLNVGAYGAEVVRGAIEAIPRDQTEASIALNMTTYQRYRRVILPQALVIMLPSFGNLLIELLKATALVSLITIPDLTFWAMSLRATTGRTIEIFGLLLLLYFLLAYPLTLGVRWLERRLRWAH